MDNLKKIIREIIKEGDREHTYYMFFQNIKQIKRQCEEILEMDRHNVDNVLKSGHDWASDHISTSKDDVEEVYNFLKEKCKKDTVVTDIDDIIESTENRLTDDEIIKLGHEIFEKYMYSDKDIKRKVKDDWSNDGLSRFGQFTNNKLSNLLSVKDNRTRQMKIHEIVDQLEILKDYIKDNSIDILIKSLLIR